MSTKKHFSSKEETKIVGINAVKTVFQQRKEDVIKLYLRKDLLPLFQQELKFLSQQKLAYHLVEEAELEKLTQTQRHQGLCLVAKQKRSLNWEQFILKKPLENCLALMDVGNPNNLGAILRSAAHFGVKNIICPDPKLLLTPTSYRIAQGAQEHLTLVHLPSEKSLFQLTQLNIELLATSGRGSSSLFSYKPTKKWCLILGAEEEGLSQEVMNHATKTLSIPGTGDVESLNVSVASGIFLAHLTQKI